MAKLLLTLAAVAAVAGLILIPLQGPGAAILGLAVPMLIAGVVVSLMQRRA